MFNQRSTAGTLLALLTAAPFANAEIMQIEFSAALNNSETGIVIDGVPGTASIGIAGMVTWDTDQTPFSDNGTGIRNWSNLSFQGAGGGTILLDTGEVIPVSFAISNTAQNSLGNRLSVFHSTADNASIMSWISGGFEFTNACHADGFISLRMGQLTAMPLASSPLPATASGYDQGVYFEQCTFTFNVARPDGGFDSVNLNTIVDQNIHLKDPVKITPAISTSALPLAALQQTSADINNDGIVNSSDLALLIGVFGTTTTCN